MTEHYTVEGQSNLMDYGFLSGNEQKLLLIKTGLGGGIYGYRNKYLHIARHFQSVGYSVLCCATPREINDCLNFETAISIAKALLGNQFPNQTIYYMGVSRGAYQGILYGNTIPQISKLLLINPPITVNFPKQIASLKAMDKKSTLVIGTRDPSFQFWPWICQIDNPHLELVEATRADHHFKRMDEELFELPKKVFLEK